MPPKLKPDPPDPNQTYLPSFFGQERQLEPNDPFLSPNPNAVQEDGFPVIIQQSSLSPEQAIFESIEPPIRPPILDSIDAQSQSQSQRELAAAAAAAAADQAAAAAAAAAAAQDARAVARGEEEQGHFPSVLTQFGHIPSPSHSISPQPPLRSRGGSVRMNKMNFLTFRGRHKSTKSKMKKRAKVTRKSYKRRSQRKRTGKK